MIAGHVGDGNFHSVTLCNPDNDDVSRAKTLANTIARSVNVTGIGHVVLNLN